MSDYEIVLADDHKMLRKGIRKLIEANPDMKVVAEVNDGLELLEVLKNITPHMIILDISMPNLRGIEATREIKMINPKIKILILSMHNKKEYVHHVFSAGAEGYLLKEDSDTELFTAIETIRRGEKYLSPILSMELARGIIETGGSGSPAGQSLTNREREVLKLIAEGKANKAIADLLYISERTVQHHRASIMKKLNINNVADLVKYAIRQGYTTTNP
ncbi:MAG: response regulator transcription factor [Desulfobacterales bacterium]|nr:response regulator transcription factor [Desulfobacterales bacterium]